MFGIRYKIILGAFLSICGKGLREELEKQTKLVQLLGMAAEKVKQASGSARQVCKLNFSNTVCAGGDKTVDSTFITQ